MIPIQISSPGKLILIGEHAAVYGRPAVVAALGARLTARFLPGGVPGVELILEDLGEHAHFDVSELVAYAAQARARWREFDADPCPETFRRLRGDDPCHLAKVALGEALDHGGTPRVQWRIEVASELRVGSGFGSSAALAAALISGTIEALSMPTDSRALEELVTEAERRQHGHPSGIDAAVVLRGGVQWIEYPDGVLAASAMGSSRLLERLRVVDTGTPEVATGEVVAAVRRLSTQEPTVFEAAVAEIGDAAGGLRVALGSEDGQLLARSLTRAERALERLGVVPDAVVDLVRHIEDQGGAAKISGAGASRGDRAGGMLVYHRRPEELADWPFLPAGSVIDASLGAPPVRRETMQ